MRQTLVINAILSISSLGEAVLKSRSQGWTRLRGGKEKRKKEKEKKDESKKINTSKSTKRGNGNELGWGALEGGLCSGRRGV